MSSYEVSHLSNMYKEISQEIFQRIRSWIETGDSAEAVVNDFQAQMLMGPQRLRSSTGDPSEGETVLPLKLNADGTLQVVCRLFDLRSFSWTSRYASFLPGKRKL